MVFTEAAKRLNDLYNLYCNNDNILELPTFIHRDCRITVTYRPTSVGGVMAVKITTSKNVIFTPFYLKNECGDICFVPFFDKPEYNAIKDEIIIPDNYSTTALFDDIAEHIINADECMVMSVNSNTWTTYKRQRTAQPSKSNDNILPMTIKNIRIGDSSRKRLYRIFPKDEASAIVNALYREGKTIVFTSDPNSERNIYALLKNYHVIIE